MSTELAGSTAVVSGASRGIGYAIASRLASDGADIVLAASHQQRLDDAAKKLANSHPARHFAVCAADLRTFDGCEAVFKHTTATMGRCDILINCAGATKGSPFLDQPDDDMFDGFALKFHSAVRLARLFWPELAARAGIVVNIVGGFARTPAADFMVGGAVNAALANFSKALAEQGLRDNVNVNWVHPGLTVTERLTGIFAKRAQQQGISAEEVARRSIASEGIRRLGEPEDVANLVGFLCSSQARHIHGTGISVDGGGAKGYY